MNNKKLIIYFTSGTGNSLKVANWMGELCEEERISFQIVPIENSDEVINRDDTLVGFVMPTHGFMPPWGMIKFVLGLPPVKGVKAFCVATRAGWKIGPFFMPGMSASNTYLISLLLAFKGYGVRGILSVDMPSNWIAMHWGLHSDNVKIMLSKSKPKVLNFADKMISGVTSLFSWNNLYELICGILMIPIGVMYQLVGRFLFAKIFFATNACDGCGICEKNCPRSAVKLKGEPKLPFWSYNCESCMRCMAFCPKSAIEASHPWLVILVMLTSLPVFTYLFSYFGIGFNGVSSLLDFLYIYPAIFISYYVFYFLVRVPIVNTIFTYTTFSHYFRRYKAPNIKVYHLCNRYSKKYEKD